MTSLRFLDHQTRAPNTPPRLSLSPRSPVRKMTSPVGCRAGSYLFPPTNPWYFRHGGAAEAARSLHSVADAGRDTTNYVSDYLPKSHVRGAHERRSGIPLVCPGLRHNDSDRQDSCGEHRF